MSAKCCLISSIVGVLFLIVLFLSIFVAFPILFMLSIDMQRLFLFEPVSGRQEEFSLDGIVPGARNIYITVSPENVTLGVWHLPHKQLYNDSIDNLYFNYSDILARGDYPVLLHCHGNGGNRIHHLEVYLELTRYFHVIAFDYRSYGDSTEAELTEKGLVEDTVGLYKWLRNQTKADIHIWGHSMGTAVATHAVAVLRRDNIIPMGLILESPYTTLREEAVQYPAAKILTWMPWFNSTILDPIWRNGFQFETSKHILNVDCPIMILHAMDDDIIPYQLAEQLYVTAQRSRNVSTQGNVRLHLFPKSFGYRHWAIYKSPKLSEYMREHIDDAQLYKMLDKIQ